ncbi:PVV-CTERM domain-containing choice-of-anchor G protein [Micromonospora thermarum]|uniref:LPXTG cell wall anchor domain-containing protein n=1 Tax=Micromonospora thermarum TaxID=2720024 RepID=A0ABX0Z112_9ACTN|nr:LPXTG cell wall anchor domain-containing protein [Micromonospora thermarum]NJP30832.1 LPXTG cell wall anchor domain-containing protein [Micromonospora thermarum]
MNRLHPALRRATAVAAGALLGLTGVAFLATPASAHHTTVTGTACETSEDGVYRVQWTVVNSEDDLAGTITEVWTPSDTYVVGVPVGRELPKSGDGKVVGVQYTAKGAELKLKITAEWKRGERTVTNTAFGTATVDETCTAEPPAQTPTPSPDVTTPAPTPTVTTPAPTTPAPTTPAPTPTQPEEPGGPLVPEEPNAPVFEIVYTCDELVITADNPADGVTATLVLTTEKGETKKLELVPGKKTEVIFKAYAGLTVTPSLEGEEADPADAVKWAQPEECGGEGGGLPKTGDNTAAIAGGAAALLAVGAGLFVMARRRKLRFTA